MNIMFLAAGEGQRFRPHTILRAKPSLPFLNIPLAYFSYELCKPLSPTNIVVNTFHQPESIKKTYKNISIKSGSALHFSDETTLLGSGGGIKKAESILCSNSTQDPFLVINADEIIIPEFNHLLLEMVEFHKKSNALATLLCRPLYEAGKKFGAAWVNNENQIYGFGKNNIANFQPLHFLGIFCFSQKIFEYISSAEQPSNIIYDALSTALTKNEKVMAYRTSSYWFESGNLSDYLNATRCCLQLLQNQNPFLLQMLNTWLPHTYEFSNKLLVLNAKDLPQSIQFKGFNVIGERIDWANRSNHHCNLTSIENSVLESGATLTGAALSKISTIKSELILSDTPFEHKENPSTTIHRSTQTKKKRLT